MVVGQSFHRKIEIANASRYYTRAHCTHESTEGQLEYVLCSSQIATKITTIKMPADRSTLCRNAHEYFV